jgi:putative intracellular protease/amidase
MLVSRHDAAAAEEGLTVSALGMHQCGRRATGFTNAEEFLARLKDVVPFLLEDEMKASGADFHSALLPLISHVEQDGHLITGQNPNSSEAVAQALVAALSQR